MKITQSAACEHGYSNKTLYHDDVNDPIKCPYCPVYQLQMCYNRLFPDQPMDKNIYGLISKQLKLRKHYSGILLKCTHCKELRHRQFDDSFASIEYDHDDGHSFLCSGYGSRYDSNYFYFCAPSLYKFIGDVEIYDDCSMFLDRFFLYEEQVLEEYGMDMRNIHWCDECLEYMMECHILFNSYAYDDMFYCGWELI